MAKVVLNSLNHVLGKTGEKFYVCYVQVQKSVAAFFKIWNLGFLIWQQNLLLLGVIYSSNTHRSLLTKHCAMGQEHLWPHRPDISGRQSQNTVFTCDSAKCQDEKSRRPRELLTEDPVSCGEPGEPENHWGWRQRARGSEPPGGWRHGQYWVMLGLEENSLRRMWVVIIRELRRHCGILNRGILWLILTLKLSLWLPFRSGLDMDSGSPRNPGRICCSIPEWNGEGGFWKEARMLEKVRSEWGCTVITLTVLVSSSQILCSHLSFICLFKCYHLSSWAFIKKDDFLFVTGIAPFLGIRFGFIA